MGTLASHPNIIILYADDLGFGDLGCYGANNIPTPNIDRLAAEGLLFQQGYATAATCTPSRYSLLTGSYPWRNPQAAILAGDAPMIIAPHTRTLPAMLRAAGYHTGIVGKWHLGLGKGDLDWNQEISLTPNDIGFDSSFIMAATNDRVPCVYVQDRKVVGLNPQDPIEVTYDWNKAFPGQPTGRHNPEMLKMSYSHGHDGSIINGVSRIGHMRGGDAALWDDETMSETFCQKAVEFVTTNKDHPFFLYYAFHQPHVPRIPSPPYKGATSLGPRGDVIAEMDGCVGTILDTLEKLEIKDQTLVIFSSDNGPVLDDGYVDQARECNGTHKPAGPLRGGKYSMFDGGTRVPFIASWPGTITAGESKALMSHVDFHASFAALTGQTLQASEAPDSLNILNALLGKTENGREELLVEGMQAKTVLRHKDWVYIPPYKGHAIEQNTQMELGNAPDPQLYNLSMDIGQMRNLAKERPAIVEQMAARREQILTSKCTRTHEKTSLY